MKIENIDVKLCRMKLPKGDWEIRSTSSRTSKLSSLMSRPTLA
ncbi:hypothetical protein AHiyo6_01880 [Arthrobacter sp. Hiyo6]|nr:hypothetical protein AHiyo6_01880 [Arthrobacter sp. Hiyo6]